ncbi:MAG: hypothetical protein ACR5KV_08070 [Wolbachia sp.]
MILPLLKRGADMNVIDNYGNTPLCIAARNCNRAVVELVFAAGASIDHRNISYLHLQATYTTFAFPYLVKSTSEK